MYIFDAIYFTQFSRSDDQKSDSPIVTDDFLTTITNQAKKFMKESEKV
jgi:hypothetical protein